MRLEVLCQRKIPMTPLGIEPATFRLIYLQSQHTNNGNCINYEHFANVKGTVYGNMLPRGTQVKNVWGPLK